jgi:ABC-type branched-subunit amino acid transport system ATPase component
VGFVPEERRIFPDLSVRENLEVGRKAAATSHATAFS